MTSLIETAILTRRKERGRDYAWVTDPPSIDLRSEWRGLSTFERPTLVMRVAEDDIAVLMSGFPTPRRDEIGTSITNTVCIAGPRAQLSEHLSGMLATWLATVTDDDDSTELVDTVERWTQECLADQAQGHALDGSAVVLSLSTKATVTDEDTKGDDDGDGSWLGDMRDRHHRILFLQHVRRCLETGRGAAAVLNLIAAPADLPRLADRNYPLFVLGDGTNLAGADPVWIDAPAVAEHGEVDRDPKAGTRRLRRGLVIAAAAAVLIAGVVLCLIL